MHTYIVKIDGNDWAEFSHEDPFTAELDAKSERLYIINQVDGMTRERVTVEQVPAKEEHKVAIIGIPASLMSAG